MARIVLTSDSALMSEYNGNEFLGFAACAPALMPEWLYKRILCPPVKPNGRGASVAGCGTRKIEAALLENGFEEGEVVVRPQDLAGAITPETRAIGITTNDPLGLGPASTTFSDLIGRRTYSALAFEKLVRNPAIRGGQGKGNSGGPGRMYGAQLQVDIHPGQGAFQDSEDAPLEEGCSNGHTEDT